MESNPASATASDRLTFTAFLALAFHGILIFGVSFAPELQRAAPHTLEVTLAQHHSDSEPEEADFIAQSNQHGSGDQADKRELTTTEQADFADSQLEKVQLKEKTTQERRDRVSQELVITTAQDSEDKVSADQKKKTDPKPLKVAKQENLQDLSQQIASLQARLDEQKQAYAKRPRVRRLTSVSTKAHFEAVYIDGFRRKVETMGTRNFPARALSSNTYGAARLMVAIQKDGTLKEVRLLKSSGHKFLDQAAIQSVRLAAPFDTFTTEMSRKMDVLEIIRTWKFDSNRRVSSK
ncbi:MAG: energy transducer TonB [Alcanivorax borkumensis]|jgi:protein TonB|uniref:TonB n=1 Tax=Alcanivorax borkumensis (strain ATCC 700651 / DSM 11573 / NCIMB 13689 / SK2) TaxID=393595 RepID=Q0VTI4_ALCBS|nr:MULTISPECIES: TonB family protein [Alcanivorax]OJH08876.1 MAG: energy transducer TonB [Alcanivorax borkumensis]EUC69033.1 cell envelope biogenesis protein TonB [Alcanivorax sp. 97CO-5]PKG01146.1 energy transducer TonB [Alcanivorax sp. 97CO-6]CAL15559.1 TonB [Alcanivorax borkumensis SK2]BAP12964.1 TonB protein [Alcanivorax sp. NBRC 101098]